MATEDDTETGFCNPGIPGNTGNNVEKISNPKTDNTAGRKSEARDESK